MDQKLKRLVLKYFIRKTKNDSSASIYGFWPYNQAKTVKYNKIQNKNIKNWPAIFYIFKNSVKLNGSHLTWIRRYANVQYRAVKQQTDKVIKKWSKSDQNWTCLFILESPVRGPIKVSHKLLISYFPFTIYTRFRACIHGLVRKGSVFWLKMTV